MAYVDLNKLSLAFRARLIAESPRFAAVVAAGHVEAPNAPLSSKPSASAWVRESLFVALESRVATALIEATGRMQFDIAVPVGTGMAEAAAFAREVAEAVPAGLTLTTGDGDRVTIDRAERLSPTTWDATWYAPGVSVLWRVYTES